MLPRAALGPSQNRLCRATLPRTILDPCLLSLFHRLSTFLINTIIPACCFSPTAPPFLGAFSNIAKPKDSPKSRDF